MISEEELSKLETETAANQDVLQKQQMSNYFAQSQPSTIDVGMIREQISLEEVYDLIDNLLEGNVLVKDNETGIRKWIEPEDENMKLFSEEGINYIRKRMAWHINKNTLFSNHKEEEIHEIVKDFSISLQDAIFMKSKQFFRQPSIEKCIEVLKARLENRKKIRMFARETLGLKADEKQIEKELLQELERTIEKEIEEIRGQLIKSREKEFESIIIDLEFLVWSTYNRSIGGEERGSIRRHQQSLEVKGGGLLGNDGKAAKPSLVSSMTSMFKK